MLFRLPPRRGRRCIMRLNNIVWEAHGFSFPLNRQKRRCAARDRLAAHSRWPQETLNLCRASLRGFERGLIVSTGATALPCLSVELKPLKFVHWITKRTPHTQMKERYNADFR
jgi:hypothetical protein